MMKQLLLVSLACCFCRSADARIHETFEQCTERYGSPVKEVQTGDTERVVRYEKGGFIITVAFFHGRAALFAFSHPNQLPLSESARAELLSDNSEGAKFIPFTENDGAIDWRRDDGKVEATYYKAKNILMLSDNAYMAQKNKSLENTTGF